MTYLPEMVNDELECGEHQVASLLGELHNGFHDFSRLSRCDDSAAPKKGAVAEELAGHEVAGLLQRKVSIYSCP